MIRSAFRRASESPPLAGSARRGWPGLDRCRITEAGRRSILAITAAAESHDPPALLVLGQDALNSFQGALGAERAELNTWEDVTVSIGFNR
jgi:hypothetical protein